MRWTCASLLAGAAMLGAPGCEQQAKRTGPPPIVRRATPPLPPIELLPSTDPPAWWSDAPLREAGTLTVCAMGDGETLLAARRKALEGAMKAFVAAAGSLPREPGVQADCAKTEEGLYRAFVRVSAAAP